MVKLTALVCVQDQADDLSECLRRLWFCDQIVVVADRCGDGSADVARRHGADVVIGSFPLERQRRAAGLQAASGDWILEIAPDERVDSPLAWEIRATLKTAQDGDHFEAPIANQLGSERVRGGWIGVAGSDREVRLYRPGAKRWAERGNDRGRGVGRSAGALTGELRRIVGESLSDALGRFNRLTDREAESLAAEAKLPGRRSAVRQGLGAFGRDYLLQSGWRDGGLGLVLAALSGLFPLVAQLKSEELVRRRLLAAAEPPRKSAGVVRLGAR